MESTLLYDYCCNSTSSLVDSGFKNLTDSPTVRISLQLKHFSLQEDSIQEIIDTDLLQCRNLAVEGLTAPLLRHETDVGELLHDTLGIGIGKVALVDGDDDGDLCGHCMVDGLPGLGHDTVIGRNDQNDDIGYLSTACPHH